MRVILGSGLFRRIVIVGMGISSCALGQWSCSWLV